MAFTPRLSAPSYSDLRWIQTGSGGYNQCIYGSDGPPSVIPNCTGYVHGRCMEIAGITTDNMGLSFGNGNTYYNGSSSAWTQSQNPTLGAVLCYDEKPGSGQLYGHVAVVEQIIDNDTVVVSESNFGGSRWDLVTCYRQYGWRPDPYWNVTPQGFLKNPYVDDTPPTPSGGLSASMLLLLYLKKKKGGRNVKRITWI